MTIQPMIPGAREQSTLTHRQSGSIGGAAFGSTDVPLGSSRMDAATIADREREGGGAPNQRRPAPALAMPRALDFAICPSCHTADTALTNDAIAKGADWHCGRCGQDWNAGRLATAGAYTAWATAR